MANAGELIYIIKADRTQFNRDMSLAESTAQKTSGGMANAFSKIGAVLAAAGVGMLAKSVVDLGIRAEETGSKFATVFNKVLNQANAEIENLTKNYGLSTLAAQDMVSTTGDLLTGFGFTQDMALDLSTQVAKLGADLASFSNYSGGAKGASEALTKALLGERESVKALGISILEEDVKRQMQIDSTNGVTFATEREAKAYATLQLALKQSKNAIGDFARTQDSTANKIRIFQNRLEDLGVSIGKQISPVVGNVVQALTNNLPQLEKFIKPLVPIFEKLGGLIVSVIDLAGQLIEPLMPFLDIAGAIVGAALDASKAVVDATKEVVKVTNDWNKAIDEGAKGTLATFKETKTFNENAAMAARTIADGLARATTEGRDLKTEINTLAEQSGYSVEQIEEYALQLGFATDEMKKQADLRDAELKKMLIQNHIQTVYINAGIKANADAMAAAAKAAEDNLASIDPLEGKFQEMRAANNKIVEDQKKATALGLLDQSIKQKMLNIEEQIKTIREGALKLIKEGGSAEATGTQAEVAKIKPLEEQLALLQAQQKELDKVAEKERKAQEEAQKAAENALTWEKAMEKLGDTVSTQVASAFQNTLAMISTSIEEGSFSWANMASIALKALGDILNALGAQLAAMAITLFPDIPMMTLAAAGSIAAYAAGGYIKANADSWAGVPVEAYNGADFIVPPGFQNDTYPVMAQSGERVQVTPETQVGQSNSLVGSTFILMIEGKPFTGYIQQQIDNRAIRV